MIGERYSRWSRIFGAATTAVSTGIGWLVVPYFLSKSISANATLAQASGSVQSILFSPNYVLAFGLVVTGLFVMGRFTKGMAVSVPFLTGAYLASAYYIYRATAGGIMKIAFGGQNLTLDFQPIILLAMTPSLFSALRVAITFLLEQSEASRAAEEAV